MNLDKFIFIGDSLTFGYGVPKNKCFVELLKNSNISSSLNLSIINKGTNGNTTTDMLNRFTEDVTLYNPKSIFIMGGTNDLLSNRSLELIIDNINLMLKEALNQTSNIYVGIPPRIIKEEAYKLFMPSSNYDYCESNLSKLRLELIKLCNNYSVKYIDFYTLTSNINSKDIFLDGIHPNARGHELFYSEFIKALNI